MIVIEVSDTGKGIPEDIRDRIFEPGFTTKGKGKGTGLGLSIAKKIMEEHGGAIDFSTETGVGTTFRLTLPAK
jgi:two-component system NtrC family sensor kinase